MYKTVTTQLYLLIYLKTYKLALYHTKADSKLRSIGGLVKLWCPLSFIYSDSSTTLYLQSAFKFPNSVNLLNWDVLQSDYTSMTNPNLI